MSKYIYYLLYSEHFKMEFKAKSKGLRGGVSVNQFKKIKIPIPPPKELIEVVFLIEDLMKKCSAIEDEIMISHESAKMLVQAVLKEAFETSDTTVTS